MQITKRVWQCYRIWLQKTFLEIFKEHDPYFLESNSPGISANIYFTTARLTFFRDRPKHWGYISNSIRPFHTLPKVRYLHLMFAIRQDITHNSFHQLSPACTELGAVASQIHRLVKFKVVAFEEIRERYSVNMSISFKMCSFSGYLYSLDYIRRGKKAYFGLHWLCQSLSRERKRPKPRRRESSPLLPKVVAWAVPSKEEAISAQEVTEVSDSFKARCLQHDPWFKLHKN